VIEDTLLRRLETEFATEVFPDTFYNRDHAISASRLSFLLRSYVMLQKSHIPEDMIARLLVQPFADENITRGKLDGRVRGSCEGLQHVYDEIREFITSKFGALLELPVCQGERKASVDLLGNAIWKPLFEVLSSKHAVVFKSSDADRFHHNYSISMKFLESLEDLCGTEQMKQRFRSHESVVEFKEKWNMDVYFQLRYNQLAAELDSSFDVKRSENGDNATSGGTRRVDGDFLFPCTRTLWEVMLKCWDHDVFLPPLLSEFTKLCLQLLLHFVAIWQEPLDEAVEQLKGPTKANFTTIQFTCLTSEEDVVCAGNDFHVLGNKVCFPALRC
jgi:conserved oligomeric Golgi complex subunit 2